MNKFKVEDIVFAIADNSEFVNNEKGNIFTVIHVYSKEGTVKIKPLCYKDSPYLCYYTYKFRKATQKEIKKFKFDYIVNKLKGV